MAGSRIDIKGLPALDATMKAKAALMRAAAAVAVAAEVRSVKSDAKAGAPRDTGELADSIDGRSTGASGTVETNNRHAGFNEFGTSKMPARPFMAPAAQSAKARFIGRTRQAVKKAVD